MTRYHRVSPNYWTLSAGWEDRVRLLGLYVQTCEHRITEGLYRLPAAYIVGDLGWPAKTADARLGDLASTGYVKYDTAAEVILLVNALEHQAPTTAKQIKGALARLRSVPATPLLCEFIRLAVTHSNGFADSIRMEMPNAFERAVSDRKNGHSSSLALSSSSVSISGSRTEL